MENGLGKLAEILAKCAMTCEFCATSCLREKDMSMLSRCIALNRDCADSCMLGARMLERDSEIVRRFLLICEDICYLCADECEKHDHDHCRYCAKVCRYCAKACHRHHIPVAQPE
jgi:hypothetical protein